MLYNLTVAKNYVAGYDAKLYDRLALHILNEHCFCTNPFMPTVERAPLWPGVIAIIYSMIGHDNFIVRLFLCFLGAGTCLLVYLLTKGIFGRQSIAMLAGLMAAVYPGLFIYDGWLYSESVYTFLLLAFCYGLYRVQQRQSTARMIASGVLLGLLSLTRPNGLAILCLVIIWGISVARTTQIHWQVAAKSVATITLIALAIVAPWTIRNYSLSQQLVPVATSDGTVLLGAYNHLIFDNTPFRGIWIRPSLANPKASSAYPHCLANCEVRQNTAYENLAGQWVESHIDEMPALLSLHFIKLWTPATPEADLPMNQYPGRVSSQIVAAMIPIMSIPVFLLAAFGLLVTWRRWRHLLFLYMVICLTIVECLYFYGSSRFRAPIEPLLLILVAGATWWVTEKWGRRRRTNIEREEETSGGGSSPCPISNLTNPW
ncbi:MAG: hypothetical protein NVS2B12_35870 [Ktedonobacteraceae bacterium]